MSKKVRKCVLCGKPLRIGEYGNNPAPLAYDGVCCDQCHRDKVIPARIANCVGQCPQCIEPCEEKDD